MSFLVEKDFFHQLSIFTCAILLLVDMWGNKVQQQKHNAAQVSNTSTIGTDPLDSIMAVLKQMEPMLVHYMFVILRN
jgi:hypothetical protein